MFLGSYVSGPGFTVLKSNRWRKTERERERGGRNVEKRKREEEGGRRSHDTMEESLTFDGRGILKFTPGRIWMFNAQNGMNKAGWWPKRAWEQFDFSCNGVSKCKPGRLTDLHKSERDVKLFVRNNVCSELTKIKRSSYLSRTRNKYDKE